jgi:hypothetical protein
MHPLPHLTTEADSLLDLLIAQCADLEALLLLARGEAAAVQARDFDEVMRLTAERATLGERLEVYHRQVADLRHRLGAAAETVMDSPTVTRITELVHGIMAQDSYTRPLLLELREDLDQQRQHLTRAQRGLTAYLNEGRMPAVACDQLA